MTDYYKVGDEYIPSTGDKQKDFELLTTSHGFDPVKLSDQFQMPGAYSDEEKQLLDQYGIKGSPKRALENAKSSYRASPEYVAGTDIENGIDDSSALKSVTTGIVPALRSTINAATFGQYPKILAGANTLFGDKSYDQNKLAADAMMAVSQEDSPFASLAGGVTGSLTTLPSALRNVLFKGISAIPGMATAIPSATRLGRIGQAALEGGKWGMAEIPNTAMMSKDGEGVGNSIASPIIGALTGGVLQTGVEGAQALSNKVGSYKLPQKLWAKVTNQPGSFVESVGGKPSYIDRQMDLIRPGTRTGMGKRADAQLSQLGDEADNIISKFDANGQKIPYDQLEGNVGKIDSVPVKEAVTNRKLSEHLSAIKGKSKSMVDVEKMIHVKDRPSVGELADMLDDGNLPFAKDISADDLDDTALVKLRDSIFPPSTKVTVKEPRFDFTAKDLNKLKQQYGSDYFKGKAVIPPAYATDQKVGETVQGALTKTLKDSVPELVPGLDKSSALMKLSGGIKGLTGKHGEIQAGGLGQLALTLATPFMAPLASGLRASGRGVSGIVNSNIANKTPAAMAKLLPILSQVLSNQDRYNK